MLKALRYFWKEQPIALSAFILAMALLLFFGGRFVSGFIYFHDPAHRNQALEAWMTPRYVSLSYSVPPEIIEQVMELDKVGRTRVKLDEVSAVLGISLTELEKRVWAAKKAHMEEIGKRGPKKPEKAKRKGEARIRELNEQQVDKP